MSYQRNILCRIPQLFVDEAAKLKQDLPGQSVVLYQAKESNSSAGVVQGEFYFVKDDGTHNLFTNTGSGGIIETDVVGESTAGAGVTVDGVQLKDGAFVTTGVNNYGSATAITAFATGGQTSAVALAKDFNEITVCATAGDSVKLPTAVAGLRVTVKNNGAAAADVFPFSGDSINTLAADTAIRLAPGTTKTFSAISATIWEEESEKLAPTDGSAAAPSHTFNTQPNMGLYKVSSTQLGVSVSGALVALADASGLTADSLRARVEPGTPNTGVTAVTHGDGKNFTTTLTVSQINAVTVADNSALADGYLLYTFPAGSIVVNSAYMSMALTLAEDTTATADVGLGTLLASDTQATLDADDAACENIITGQTAANASGTATVKTIANQILVIEAADAHTVYFNIADTWADTAGADLTGDIAGTVTISWTLMA